MGAAAASVPGAGAGGAFGLNGCCWGGYCCCCDAGAGYLAAWRRLRDGGWSTSSQDEMNKAVSKKSDNENFIRVIRQRKYLDSDSLPIAKSPGIEETALASRRNFLTMHGCEIAFSLARRSRSIQWRAAPHPN